MKNRRLKGSKSKGSQALEVAGAAAAPAAPRKPERERDFCTQLLPPFKMEKIPMQMQLKVCIMNYLLFAASIFFACWVASPIVGAAVDAAAFPSWVFGNHTACSACSHFQPIDVDAVNAKAYARALLCNISQPVVIVPGDTPVRTTRPLQMVRPRMLACTYCPPPLRSLTRMYSFQVNEEKLRVLAAVRACKDYDCCVIAVSGGNGNF